MHHAWSCTQHHLLPSCQQARPPGFFAEPPSEGHRCRSQVTGVCEWQDTLGAPGQSATAGSFSWSSLSGARGAAPLPRAALHLSICASRTRSCGNSRTGLVTQAGCMTREQAAPPNTVSCRRPAANTSVAATHVVLGTSVMRQKCRGAHDEYQRGCVHPSTSGANVAAKHQSTPGSGRATKRPEVSLGVPPLMKQPGAATLAARGKGLPVQSAAGRQGRCQLPGQRWVPEMARSGEGCRGCCLWPARALPAGQVPRRRGR